MRMMHVEAAPQYGYYNAGYYPDFEQCMPAPLPPTVAPLQPYQMPPQQQGSPTTRRVVVALPQPQQQTHGDHGYATPGLSFTLLNGVPVPPSQPRRPPAQQRQSDWASTFPSAGWQSESGFRSRPRRKPREYFLNAPPACECAILPIDRQGNHEFESVRAVVAAVALIFTAAGVDAAAADGDEAEPQPTAWQHKARTAVATAAADDGDSFLEGRTWSV